MYRKKYIITGPPGAGKTTLINVIKESGISVISEASRDVIIQQQLIKGDAVPWKNVTSYAFLVFDEIFLRLKTQKQAEFTDRSLVDVIAYLEFSDESVFKELLKFPFLDYYHKTVFFAPSWEEIYQTDDQRPQSYVELKGLSEKIKEVYERLGFTCISLPKVSPQERFKFILKNIDCKKEL